MIHRPESCSGTRYHVAFLVSLTAEPATAAGKQQTCFGVTPCQSRESLQPFGGAIGFNLLPLEAADRIHSTPRHEDAIDALRQNRAGGEAALKRIEEPFFWRQKTNDQSGYDDNTEQ